MAWRLPKRRRRKKEGEEEKEEGNQEAGASRTGRGSAVGNRLTPKPPLLFGTHSSDGGQLELAEQGPQCGNRGRGPLGAGVAQRRLARALLPSQALPLLPSFLWVCSRDLAS